MLTNADLTGETRWRVVMPRFVAGVSTLGGRIIYTAPILSQFLNQPISNLERWVKQEGGAVELVRQGWAEPGLSAGGTR